MKKTITYIVVLAMSITMANAQLKGGAGFFKTGYLYAPGAANMLTQIAPENSLHFSNHYLIMGVEAYYRNGKNIVSLEAYSGEQTDCSFGTNSYSDPYIGSAHIKIGRIIKENKQHWLYPSIGVGGSTIALATYRTENGKTTNAVSQTLVAPSVDIGINEDFILTKMDPEEKTYGGLMLGIRAGYSTSFSSTNWKTDGANNLNNKPSYSNNYFYLSVSIGSGGFTSK